MSDAAPPQADGSPLTLRDGTAVVLRPEVPADEALVAAFHAALSPRSVYQRYFHIATLDERSGPPRLATGRAVDPMQGAALVAEGRMADGGREILGLGRIQRSTADAAEIAIVVADRIQGQGVGSALTRALIEVARALGVRRLAGDMFADNDAMRAVVRRAGFTVRPAPGDARILRAELTLD